MDHSPVVKDGAKPRKIPHKTPDKDLNLNSLFIYIVYATAL